MTNYIEVAGSLIMNGPTGIMVSLGLENVPGMPLAEAYMYYNYITVCLMFLIAAMAGSRSESRFCIFIPIVGGICTMMGWVHTGNNTQFIVFLVMTAIFGVFSYMNDVNHEKYGIAGPGSKLLNIVFFLILFQVAVGAISGFNIFSDAGQSQPIPNACTVGYQCDTYGNIDLSKSIVSLSESGGLLTSVSSLVSALPGIALSSVVLVINILISVTAFPVVLNASISGIYPGITSNAAYLSALILMEAGIWAVYLLTIFTWFFKPMSGEGTI